MVAAITELPRVRVSGITLSHASATIVENVSFDVARGETVALVGPSGAGKSTILAALAGLHAPSAGTIATEHGILSGPTSRHAIVFQDGALFPWLTLRQNVNYALARRSVSRSMRRARTDELLARVRLSEHGEKFPHELSGGMKKRGAFARALATDPDLLLLDEPFSALDVATRAELHRELASLFTHRGVAVVLVTHDLAEAVLVADRALVIRPRIGSRASTITEEIVTRVPGALEALERALSSRKEESDAVVETRGDRRVTGPHRAFDLDARVITAR